MKKLFFAVALLLGLSALLVSCSKEEQYAEVIVGAWQMSKMEAIDDGIVIDVEEGTGSIDERIVFTNDGYAYIVEDPSERISYSVNGSILILNGSTAVTIITLTKSEMILEIEGPDYYEDDVSYNKIRAYFKRYQ